MSKNNQVLTKTYEINTSPSQIIETYNYKHSYFELILDHDKKEIIPGELDYYCNFIDGKICWKILMILETTMTSKCSFLNCMGLLQIH